jgi:septal ring factor EnvC (AmiA/AmiB activator)
MGNLIRTHILGIGISALLSVPAFTVTTIQPKTTSQYQREIKEKNSDLAELKKTLSQKRREKEKCLQEEKSIRKEMQRIDQELSSLQKRSNTLRKEIREAERNLAKSEKELKLAGCEKQQWVTVRQQELDSWYRAHHSYVPLFADPITEKMRMQSLVQKNCFLGDAQRREALSKKAVAKWQAAQNKLLDLKKQQEANIAQYNATKEQKKNLLKSTIGKRVGAEEEIKKIQESAKALEQFIVKLQRDKKRTEQAAGKTQEKSKTIMTQKKNRLSWPVKGDIIVTFGKNKHPEMDTYVISNGIKIKTSPGTNVAAVVKGEVIFCGEFRSYGQMIILDHGNSFYTVYGNLGDILVEENQKVNEGAVIGKTENGLSSALYFEVRSESQPEDPLLWLK